MTNSEPRRTMPQVCDNYVEVRNNAHDVRAANTAQITDMPMPCNTGRILNQFHGIVVLFLCFAR